MRFNWYGKKINKRLVLVLAGTACVLSGCSAAKFNKPGQEKTVEQIEEKNDKDKFNEFISNPASSEENQFVFVEPEITGDPEEGGVSKSTRVIKLYLGDNIYYPLEIPMDLEIITDHSKYIYAVDHSLSISVMSSVPCEGFSKYVAINDPEPILPNLIRSTKGAKGPQEAAKHIANDKAIVVRAYNNQIAFETVFKSLEENTYKVTNYGGMAADKNTTQILETLPAYTGFHVTVNAGLGDEIQKIYHFKDGNLTIAREFKKWNDSIGTNGTKVAVIENDNIADKIYQSEDAYYVEKGDYTLGIVMVNYNTTISLFGSGKEARFNIISFLKN